MKAEKIGILSAIFASACCAGPIALSILGLGSLGLGSAMGKYHWHLLGGALAFLLLAWGIFLKEKKRMYALTSEIRNEGLTKTILTVATLVVVFFLGLSLYSTFAIYSLHAMHEGIAQESHSSGKTLAGEVVTLHVEGMTCFACEFIVESTLKKLKGVLNAEAKASEKSVTVIYDPKQVTPKEMVKSINSTRYKASLPD